MKSEESFHKYLPINKKVVAKLANIKFSFSFNQQFV